MPECLRRIEAVRNFRLASDSKPTQKIAATPTRFHVENMPATQYLLIPKVSSERRKYIPIGFIDPSVLTSDLCFIMEKGTLFHFGILSSVMHMAWMRQVAGRLESRYRYSSKLVYNNYPWPKDVTDKQRQAVEKAAQGVLDARTHFPNSTLADLYDPLTMPPELSMAHIALDRAVDRCYRAETFDNDRKRIEFLFALYEKITTPLIPVQKPKRKKDLDGGSRLPL
jgi:hypothetical protein